MNIALTLPRLFHAGFLPSQARPRGQVNPALLPRPQAMAKHTMLKLDNRHLQLRVLRGCVWITRDGCQADLVLGAGEVFEQRPGAPVLVQALEEVELLIAG